MFRKDPSQAKSKRKTQRRRMSLIFIKVRSTPGARTDRSENYYSLSLSLASCKTTWSNSGAANNEQLVRLSVVIAGTLLVFKDFV